MATIQNEYTAQANDFLKATNTTFTAEFAYCGKYFAGDESKRDIYIVTLSNSKHTYEFKFGQSIMDSARYQNGNWEFMTDGSITGIMEGSHHVSRKCPQIGKKLSLTPALTPDQRKNKTAVKPSAYDVLACLTKYDPESFHNFCDEFGYDNDSISAEKVYNSVMDEWRNVSRLFTSDQLGEMSEIQ